MLDLYVWRVGGVGHNLRRLCPWLYFLDYDSYSIHLCTCVFFSVAGESIVIWLLRRGGPLRLAGLVLDRCLELYSCSLTSLERSFPWSPPQLLAKPNLGIACEKRSSMWIRTRNQYLLPCKSFWSSRAAWASRECLGGMEQSLLPEAPSTYPSQYSQVQQILQRSE